MSQRKDIEQKEKSIKGIGKFLGDFWNSFTDVDVPEKPGEKQKKIKGKSLHEKPKKIKEDEKPKKRSRETKRESSPKPKKESSPKPKKESSPKAKPKKKIHVSRKDDLKISYEIEREYHDLGEIEREYHDLREIEREYHDLREIEREYHDLREIEREYNNRKWKDIEFETTTRTQPTIAEEDVEREAKRRRKDERQQIRQQRKQAKEARKQAEEEEYVTAEPEWNDVFPDEEVPAEIIFSEEEFPEIEYETIELEWHDEYPIVPRGQIPRWAKGVLFEGRSHYFYFDKNDRAKHGDGGFTWAVPKYAITDDEKKHNYLWNLLDTIYFPNQKYFEIPIDGHERKAQYLKGLTNKDIAQIRAGKLEILADAPPENAVKTFVKKGRLMYSLHVPKNTVSSNVLPKIDYSYDAGDDDTVSEYGSEDEKEILQFYETVIE
jgi:hypothetical protein